MVSLRIHRCFLQLVMIAKKIRVIVINSTHSLMNCFQLSKPAAHISWLHWFSEYVAIWEGFSDLLALLESLKDSTLT